MYVVLDCYSLPENPNKDFVICEVGHKSIKINLILA